MGEGAEDGVAERSEVKVFCYFRSAGGVRLISGKKWKLCRETSSMDIEAIRRSVRKSNRTRHKRKPKNTTNPVKQKEHTHTNTHTHISTIIRNSGTKTMNTKTLRKTKTQTITQSDREADQHRNTQIRMRT